MFSLKDQLAFREGANRTIKKLQENIRDKSVTKYGSMNNTGEAALSLRYRWIGEDRIQVYSDMPSRSFNYIMTLETGRKPGKPPPIQTILEWMEQRGINPTDITKKSLAFLIARKIGNEGSLVFRIRGGGGTTGIISEVQTNDWILENFIKPLEMDLKRSFEQVLSEIVN